MSMDEEEHKEIHLILLLDLNTSMEKGKDGLYIRYLKG